MITSFLIKGEGLNHDLAGTQSLKAVRSWVEGCWLYGEMGDMNGWHGATGGVGKLMKSKGSLT